MVISKAFDKKYCFYSAKVIVKNLCYKVKLLQIGLVLKAYQKFKKKKGKVNVPMCRSFITMRENILQDISNSVAYLL